MINITRVTSDNIKNYDLNKKKRYLDKFKYHVNDTSKDNYRIILIVNKDISLDKVRELLSYYLEDDKDIFMIDHSDMTNLNRHRYRIMAVENSICSNILKVLIQDLVLTKEEIRAYKEQEEAIYTFNTSEDIVDMYI